jgi:hypothetical protein
MMRRMGALLAAALIAVSLAAPLRAQDSRDEAPPAVALKSEKTAMAFAVVGSIVPWALLLCSATLQGAAPAYLAALTLPIGPSLGYFYAGSPGRGLLGTGIRVGIIVGLVALGTSLHDAGHDSSTTTSTLFFGGIIAVASSYVIDIAGIRKAVRRHNLKAQGLQMAVAPVISPKTRSYGLQVQLSF